MDTARRQERVRCKESNMEIYITICKTASQWEFPVWLRELKQGLCDNLEGWGGEGVGREVQEGGDMSVPILVDVWQKTTNFCKAIILQLKTKVAKKKSADLHQDQKILCFKRLSGKGKHNHRMGENICKAYTG